MKTRRPAPIAGNSRPPTSPGHAYAALCGLSAVEHPSRWQQARMRMLAKYLLDATADRSV